MYIHIYIYIYTHIHTYTHIKGAAMLYGRQMLAQPMSVMRLRPRPNIYIYIYRYNIYIYIYIYICAHIYIYTYIYIYIYRFPSFRTQTLESLSHYLWTNGLLSNPGPGENLVRGNLVMETGCMRGNTIRRIRGKMINNSSTIRSCTKAVSVLRWYSFVLLDATIVARALRATV